MHRDAHVADIRAVTRERARRVLEEPPHPVARPLLSVCECVGV